LTWLLSSRSGAVRDTLTVLWTGAAAPPYREK
jgi:hypothetical protein